MTDRELLEKAAKAADIPHGADRIDCGLSLTNADGRHTSLPRWNPLADDGDALRLAVKLELKIDWGAFDVVVTHFDSDSLGRERKGDDPYDATRRAIVGAAAEIGRAML